MKKEKITLKTQSKLKNMIKVSDINFSNNGNKQYK